MDINRFIAEKVFGLKEGKDFGKIDSHVWLKHDDGKINEESFYYEHHTGVTCTRCDETFCIACNDGIPEEPCTIDPPDFNSPSGYTKLIDEISYKYLVTTSIYHGNTLCVIMDPNTSERLAHAVERTHYEALCSAVVKLFS